MVDLCITSPLVGMQTLLWAVKLGLGIAGCLKYEVE